MIPITRRITLNDKEIEETFARSFRPGGQNADMLLI